MSNPQLHSEELDVVQGQSGLHETMEREREDGAEQTWGRGKYFWGNCLRI